MKLAAFIFARGGSKGLIKKNIRNLAGKPLIAWSIEHAQAVKQVDRIIVSTDCDEIADVAREFGAEVPFMRPPELAKDDTPEWLAWRHALETLKDRDGFMPEIMLSVPPTAPLRAPRDLEDCLDEFKKGYADIVITVTDAHRNPWFNMVKKNDDGSFSLVMTSETKISRRQDAPVIFDMTTVAYVARSQFVMQKVGVFSGKVSAVCIPKERAIDIDTQLDFEFAEFLLNRRSKEPFLASKT